MWKNRDDFAKKDEKGRWYNSEFPPVSYSKYPTNDGYKTPGLGILLYWYAVQYYDITVKYKGVEYILCADEDGCMYILNTISKGI